MSTSVGPSIGPSVGRERAIVRPLDQPGDLGWVIMEHGQVYASEFHWDTDIEVFTAQIVTAYAQHHDPAREAAWIAEVDGQRAGCVFCVAADAETAKLRILLVHPRFRGHGLGARLVDTCLNWATAAGYQRMMLWTNDILTSARRIYQAAGFQLVDSQPHHSFGHDLVGQNWAREL
jgi:GNAT superfamily N-acetyltransferase